MKTCIRHSFWLFNPQAQAQELQVKSKSKYIKTKKLKLRAHFLSQDFFLSTPLVSAPQVFLFFSIWSLYTPTLELHRQNNYNADNKTSSIFAFAQTLKITQRKMVHDDNKQEWLVATSDIGGKRGLKMKASLLLRLEIFLNGIKWKIGVEIFSQLINLPTYS